MFGLFGGDTYYPHGGGNDLIGVFETYDDALKKYNKIKKKYIDYGWIHIINLSTKKIRIQEGENIKLN